MGNVGTSTDKLIRASPSKLSLQFYTSLPSTFGSASANPASAMTSNQFNQFIFVSGQPKSKRSAADNFLIRSRCMIGVNKKDTSTRSVREAKRAVRIEDVSIGAAGVKALEFADANPLSISQEHLRHKIRQPSSPRSLQAPLNVNPKIEQIAKSVCKSPEALLRDCTEATPIKSTSI